MGLEEISVSEAKYFSKTSLCLESMIIQLVSRFSPACPDNCRVSSHETRLAPAAFPGAHEGLGREHRVQPGYVTPPRPQLVHLLYYFFFTFSSCETIDNTAPTVSIS